MITKMHVRTGDEVVVLSGPCLYMPEASRDRRKHGLP